MKQLIKFISIVITFNIVFTIFPGKISAQQYDGNFEMFYNQLNPYGYWIENPDYGYVWIPSAGPDFTPYLSDGYWVLTDYGWTWVSDYDWGWATFHYGRWDFDNYYGWFWVPDNEWGPSWVTWRRSEGYYGWAPMRPGFSISITFGNNYDVPYDRWIFVRDRDIERHDIFRNHINRENNITIINNSTVINKTYYDDRRHTTYVTGPGREDVQKVIGKTINPVTIHERDKPGQSIDNNKLQIYRPRVQKNESGQKQAPPKITNVKDIKRISERDVEKQPRNKQVLDSKKGNEQQPVINPVNKTNRKENPSQNRKTNTQDNKVNKVQKPNVNNPVNKIERKENPTQKQNTNSPKNKINKEQQPVEKPVNKIERKENPAQKQNTNSPKNKINKEQQPVVNPVNKTSRIENPSQNRKTNTQDNKVNKVQKPVVKKEVNKTTNKNNTNQQTKTNPDDDRKKNKKSN